MRSGGYQYTQKGAFKLLLSNCKLSAETRLSRGREEAGVFSLTYEDLNELWINQNGRCHHSGIPMNVDKNEWRVSVDRLNNDKGYIRENICLCCIEFNSRKIWTEAKVNEMLSILEEDITENYVSFAPYPKKEKYGKVVKSIINNIEHKNCTSCDEIFPISNFRSHTNYCNECHKKHCIEKDKYPRYRLKKLLDSTKSATAYRKAKNNEKHDFSYDIDLDFLIELYNEQKGLCAYSGLPLKLIKPSEGNWAASIERKNSLKGYTKDNICLVCCEFNVADNAAKQLTTESGTSGWTPEKFALFLGYIWLRKGEIASEDELQVFLEMQKETICRVYEHANKTPKQPKPPKERNRSTTPRECLRTRAGIRALREINAYTQAKRIYGQIILLTSPSQKQYVYKTEILDQSRHNIFSHIKKIGHTIMMKEIEEQGEDNFTVEHLLTCKKELLDIYQDQFIKEYNTIYPNGLNPSGKKYTTKETRQKITNTLVNKQVRYDHNNQVLPKYMKMVNWKDRIGYAVNAHPKCKLRYFVSTDQNADMQKLYDECLAHLETLNVDD